MFRESESLKRQVKAWKIEEDPMLFEDRAETIAFTTRSSWRKGRPSPATPSRRRRTARTPQVGVREVRVGLKVDLEVVLETSRLLEAMRLPLARKVRHGKNAF